MRLPKLTAGQIVESRPTYKGSIAPARGPAGIEMSLDIGCLLGCGIGILPCLVCGPVLPCWALCAGPQAINCITKCL